MRPAVHLDAYTYLFVFVDIILVQNHVFRVAEMFRVSIEQRFLHEDA